MEPHAAWTAPATALARAAKRRQRPVQPKAAAMVNTPAHRNVTAKAPASLPRPRLVGTTFVAARRARPAAVGTATACPASPARTAGACNKKRSARRARPDLEANA